MEVEVLYLFRKPSKRFFSIESIFSTIQQEVSGNFSTRAVRLAHSGGSPLIIFLNLVSFRTFGAKKSTLVHITGDIHYMGIWIGPSSILTIHDTQSALKGNFFKKWYIKLFWFCLPALRVRYITVISDFTRKELIRQLPFAETKIKVIPNPLSDLFQYFPKQEFNGESPLILCVGTKENKNLERTIAAISTLNCRLHIIGSLNPVQISMLEDHQVSFRNSVGLSLEEVVKAYQECDLLCFPSTYEGFGMPIIEAQATGRPVLTSDLGAMKEVAKDTACLVDPFDVDSIRQGIQRILSDQAYREHLIEKGLENVKRFDAKVIAESYMKLYREMVE